MSRTDEEFLTSAKAVLDNRDGAGLSLAAQQRLMEVARAARGALHKIEVLVFRTKERDLPRWEDRGLPNQLSLLQWNINVGLGRPRT